MEAARHQLAVQNRLGEDSEVVLRRLVATREEEEALEGGLHRLEVQIKVAEALAEGEWFF